MKAIRSFAGQHPVLSYYVLAFGISWGGIVLVLGPGGFLGTTQTPHTQLYVGGPISLLGPSISGILMTALIHGRQGLREFWARLRKWRVGMGWYAIALLTGPALITAALLSLSVTPAIVSAPDKMGLLLTGMAISLGVPIFEELGWTGFATPELRTGHGMLTTGVLMGVLWGVWHFPIFSANGLAAVGISPALYLVINLFSWLVPYRVLMVWVYDHTQSLLLGMLMHYPIVLATFVLFPSGSTSLNIAARDLVFGVLLWAMVAFVVVGERGRVRSQKRTPAAA